MLRTLLVIVWTSVLRVYTQLPSTTITMSLVGSNSNVPYKVIIGNPQRFGILVVERKH